ncbi:MAG: DUF2905 domain-containing protein [Deltaproteobacteria bacterium]|nr:DUF2905 domain-containing protein [Deltaproteobacteria bacterium]
MSGIGKIMVLMGLFLVIIGLLFLVGEKIPYVGKLPGDIHIKKERFTFYFPITTSLIISLILTLFFSLFRR